MGGKTGYPVSWYTNDKEEGNFMEIEATSADRNLLLEMKGELDHHGARNALRELELSIDAALPKKLVLDLAGVTFMDSSGIALILRAQQRAARDRAMAEMKADGVDFAFPSTTVYLAKEN